MVSLCLPSDALLQHLPSYLGFSYPGRGVSLHGCCSKVQPLLLTLDEGYLLIAAPSDLERGIAPLGPPALAQPPLLGGGVVPPGRGPWPPTRGISSQLFLRRHSLTLSAAAPDVGRGVTPLGRLLWSMGSSRLLPLTLDVGQPPALPPKDLPLKNVLQLSSVQFSRSVVSDPLQPHELQHSRPPCPSPTPGVHSNSCPSSL